MSAARVLEEPLNRAAIEPIKAAAIAKLFAKGVLTPLYHSTQQKMHDAFHKTDSEEFLALSSRQLGKSWWLLCEVLEVLIKFPGSRALYYAPTKDKLRDIINDNLEPLQLWTPEDLIRRNKSSDRWFVGGKKDPKTGKWKGQSELRLCVLERAHVDRNRGINARVPPGQLGIAIEEPCFVSSEDFEYAWNSVIDAQRLRHKPRVALATTPSTDEDHYVHTVLLPKLEALGATARYTIYDNPHLTDESIEQIKSRVTIETWLREYMAEIFRSKESVAVPEYEESKHVQSLKPPAFACWATIIDFGGSLDPHGIALSYWDHSISKWCIYRDDLIPVNTSIAEVIHAAWNLEDKFLGQGHHLRIIDCSGQVSIEINKLLGEKDGKARWFTHMTPIKGPGSFDASLQALRVAFQNDQILVDEAATNSRVMLKYGKLNKQRDDFRRTTTHHCELIATAMYGFKHKQAYNPTPAPDSAATFTIKQPGWAMDGVAASFAPLATMWE